MPLSCCLMINFLERITMILFGSSLQYDAANIEIATINLFQGGTYLPIIILERFFLNFLFCLTVGILLQPNQKTFCCQFLLHDGPYDKFQLQRGDAPLPVVDVVANPLHITVIRVELLVICVDIVSAFCILLQESIFPTRSAFFFSSLTKRLIHSRVKESNGIWQYWKWA